MAGRFVRESKLRNVFGQSFKKDQFFESIRISKNSNTQMFCAVNPKFMAVVTHAAGGGSFLVLPHNKTGRLDINQAQVIGHKAPVIDIAWSPFDDNMIASCDENGVIMIWEIPDEGVTTPMEEPLLMQDLHQKRCSLIKWHPLASNVILSCGVDLKIVVWNMDEGSAEVVIDCPDIVQDMCWSPDGKTFATGSKDKKIRVYEGRTGKLVKELPGHASPREMRIAMLKDNKLLSTGFTKESRREYRLWDLNDTSDSLYEDSLDQTNAPLNILYDPDIGIVYLVGKGDCVIRYYEVNDEEPYFHYLSTYQSSSPQRGMGFMPKRGCNVNACEIARLYKVTLSSGGSIGAVEPLSMIIPRKSELYQSDIFPDTIANEPAVSASDWFAGTDGKPKYMSMQQFFVEKGATTGKGGLKKGGLKKTTTAAAPAASAPAASAPAAAPVSSARAPVSKFTPSNHSNTEEDGEEQVPAAAPEPKAPETKPEPKAEPKVEPKAEPKVEPKVEKKPDSKPPSTPPATTPSEPPAPKAPAPKAQSKKPSEPAAKKKNAMPNESTTPKGGKTQAPPVLDGKMSVSDILLDVRNLRNTVSKHEASIMALEDLQLNQSKEVQDLVAEITKLKATVAEQEKRITALEAQ